MTQRFKRMILPLLLAMVLIFTGCTSSVATTGSAATATTKISPIKAEAEDSQTTYDSAQVTTITLNDEKSSVTISKAGTYVIKGNLQAGQLIVNVDKKEKVHLILSGVTIKSPSGPALWIQSAEKVILTLEKGTVNTLQDSKQSETSESTDAALFSNEDLSINGAGKLVVEGNDANGIKSKDTLLIMGGTLQVSAVAHAISGKDAVGIFGGTFTLTSGKDGIHSSDQVYVKSGKGLIQATDDGIHGDTSLLIDGGTIHIAKSYEGLESAAIQINGGTITVVAKDDGLNAAGGNDGSALEGKTVETEFSTNTGYFIKVTGGNLSVNAEGDGIDANGSLYFTGGTVNVNGPTNNGNGALDYDQTCEVTGGTLNIAGSSGMAQAPSTTSKQNSIMITYTSVQKAGTVASLVDSNGKVIATFTPSKNYQSILFSSSKIVQGKTYTLKSGKTELTKITVSKVTTSVTDKGVEVVGRMGGAPMGGTPGQGPEGGDTGNRGMKPPTGLPTEPPVDGMTNATTHTN